MATDFSAFLKKNKKETAPVEYAATKAFVDEKGNPLKWKFKAITSKEYEELQKKNRREVPVKGKPGMTLQKTDVDKLNADMVVACTVFPDLQNAELQDSYGVQEPRDLLYKMVDSPGEYNDLVAFVTKLCGFDISLEEKVDEAKN